MFNHPQEGANAWPMKWFHASVAWWNSESIGVTARSITGKSTLAQVRTHVNCIPGVPCIACRQLEWWEGWRAPFPLALVPAYITLGKALKIMQLWGPGKLYELLYFLQEWVFQFEGNRGTTNSEAVWLWTFILDGEHQLYLSQKLKLLYKYQLPTLLSAWIAFNGTCYKILYNVIYWSYGDDGYIISYTIINYVTISYKTATATHWLFLLCFLMHHNTTPGRSCFN